MIKINVQWRPFDGDPGVMNSITFARREFAEALANLLQEIMPRIAGNGDAEVVVEQYNGHWPISVLVSVPPSGLTEQQSNVLDLAVNSWFEFEKVTGMLRAARLTGDGDVCIRHCAPLRQPA